MFTVYSTSTLPNMPKHHSYPSPSRGRVHITGGGMSKFTWRGARHSPTSPHYAELTFRRQQYYLNFTNDRLCCLASFQNEGNAAILFSSHEWRHNLPPLETWNRLWSQFDSPTTLLAIRGHVACLDFLARLLSKVIVPQITYQITLYAWLCRRKIDIFLNQIDRMYKQYIFHILN